MGSPLIMPTRRVAASIDSLNANMVFVGSLYRISIIFDIFSIVINHVKFTAYVPIEFFIMAGDKLLKILNKYNGKIYFRAKHQASVL